MNKMNILQTRFTESDIPYHEFEKLGFSKQDIAEKLNRDDLERLLGGKRTSLHEIRGIDSKEQNFSIKTKFSLLRREDGSTTLNIHPVRPVIKNDIGLSNREIKKLHEEQLIATSIQGERYLVQLDKETNELLKVKTKNINVPARIKDVELSNVQREQLRKGKPISIEIGGEKIQVEIDLDTQKGLRFSGKSFGQKQKEAYDRSNPHIIGDIQTDRNRHEFLNYRKNLEHKTIHLAGTTSMREEQNKSANKLKN
jgi:hypothetical protein